MVKTDGTHRDSRPILHPEGEMTDRKAPQLSNETGFILF
jgi:hypothetical protein